MKRRQIVMAAVLSFLIAFGIGFSAENAFAAGKKPGKVKYKTIRVISNTASTLTLAWKKPARATKYKVAYRKGKGKWRYVTVRSREKNVTQTIYRLKSGREYCIRIKAYNGKASSKWSKKLYVRPREISQYRESIGGGYYNRLFLKKSDGKKIKVEIGFYRLIGTDVIDARFISKNKVRFTDEETRLSGTLTIKGDKVVLDLKEVQDYYFDLSLSEFINGLHHEFTLRK